MARDGWGIRSGLLRSSVPQQKQRHLCGCALFTRLNVLGNWVKITRITDSAGRLRQPMCHPNLYFDNKIAWLPIKKTDSEKSVASLKTIRLRYKAVLAQSAAKLIKFLYIFFKYFSKIKHVLIWEKQQNTEELCIPNIFL